MWDHVVVENNGKYWKTWELRAGSYLKRGITHRCTPAAIQLNVPTEALMAAIERGAGVVSPELRAACDPGFPGDSPYMAVSMVTYPCNPQVVLGVTNHGAAGVGEIMDAYARLRWRRRRNGAPLPYGVFVVETLNETAYTTCATWFRAHFTWPEELTAFYAEQDMDATSAVFWGDDLFIRSGNGDEYDDLSADLGCLTVLRNCIADDDGERCVCLST